MTQASEVIRGFVDGNKRVGLAAALIFLWINGYELRCEQAALEGLVVSVAKGERSKAEVAVFVKAHLPMRGS